MIYEIWGTQRRWLHLYDAISTTPASVTTCVPQGDAWAMLAMAILLTIPWPDLKQRSHFMSTTELGAHLAMRNACQLPTPGMNGV